MDHPGEVIKLWRKDQKISILALARSSGIDKGTISRFERCGDFEMRVFKTLCDALGKSLAEAYAEMAKPQHAPSQDEIGICKAHAEEYKLLELIMHGTRPDRDYWIKGIQSNLVAMSKAATEESPEGEHGPFGPTGTPMPGDRVGFADYPAPVPAKTSKKRIIKRK